MAAINCRPSRTLPPVSITATASSPTMKPTLAIAPSFSRVICAVLPLCTSTPSATELTGSSCCCAREAVAVASIASAIGISAARAIFRPPFRHEALSAIPCYVVARFALQHGQRGRYRGLFQLHAPIDKLSILVVCGFNGTSFLGVADVFPKLATMVGRKCSSFR
jgi:hypothetical protein